MPRVRALRTEAPITVDGVLDEPFWQQAEVSGQFTDLRTGKPAQEQTSIRIAYTRTCVYIAVECFDSHMDQIHASELREDRFFKGDDWVEVHVDPTHSHRAKYAFFSNPLGTRVDASEGPGGEFSTAWSAEWELEARMYEDRWTFEMSLPLGIMNYTQADNQTWGINFTRKLIHTDTTSFWSFNDTDYFKPRFFGHLTDLNLADSQFDRNLELTPYVSSRVDYNGKTDTNVQTGADVSFRLSPSVITAWTLNPDFGQVESDADTIELRDTERFLPEKRLFFREGDELLRMKNRLYYSRRFTDIAAGAKASGDWGDYKFSFLNIYGDTTHSNVTHEGNSSVFRVLQNVGQNSNLGYYLSASEFEEGHSRVLGQDGSFYLDENWHYRYQLAVADDQLPDELGATAKDRTDYLGHTSLNYENYPWDIVAGYDGISQDFNPVLGFIPRRNIFGPFVTASYGLRSSTEWYKDFKILTDVRYYEDDRREVALRDYNVRASVDLQNDLGFSGGYEDEFHAPFNNTRTDMGIELFESDYWRSLGLGWAFGTFEEIDYDELILGKRFKPIERWPIRYEFTIRFEEDQPDRDSTIWLNRVVFDYFFSDDMWLKSSLQHRSTNVHNVSLIYGWEFIKDAKWYLVYNNVREDETGVHSDMTQSLFTKVAFTFR
ncbi:MAG: carbohydrate binding family 9 domain-containing protein [Planctomycetes bacterium]|nr:carbohydrate binding family 9 domain-containing protein [Planctomycetota bacterium]